MKGWYPRPLDERDNYIETHQHTLFRPYIYGLVSIYVMCFYIDSRTTTFTHLGLCMPRTGVGQRCRLLWPRIEFVAHAPQVSAWCLAVHRPVISQRGFPGHVTWVTWPVYLYFC